ncbi:tetratricopeptide repeat protein [Nonomuraea sp. NPDC046570]|uniref:tetratricopeptide repeat protein n=1 Tax=Nonomuraea sp. NPDC046570 TaxID=3155255 RepID=UPI0033E937EC
MTRCAQPDCTGTIEEGYCDLCGHAEAVAAPAAAPVVALPEATAPSTRPSGSRSRGGVLGEGLVDLPAVPYRDPAQVVMARPEVPEGKRFCASSACGKPVGRSTAGRPGRAEGFCPHCRTPYSFTPKLGKGDLVAGQYRVLGCLAHGGLGWIYLAADENLDGRWVVLKGLLNTADAEALAAAEAERRFLTSVDHPNIVKIINFQRHPDPGTGVMSGYIIMEYVGGASLQDLLRDRLGETGNREALPLRRSIPYALEILRAFGYLHEQGLVYCDLKPANAIQVGQRLKVIDLGAVQRIGARLAGSYVTVGYHAPEIATSGPSVVSDLYTVGRTLAVLSRPFSPARDGAEAPLPGAEAWGNESFHRFLLRATHPDPGGRFQDAGEMAEQLTGVLREVRAAEDGMPYPAQSALFGPERIAAGTTLAEDRRLVFDPLSPAEAVAALPVPLVDPEDPAAAMLGSLVARDPRELLARLAALPQTPETRLAGVRVLAELGDPEAGPALDEAERVLPGDWRVTWYRAVHRLASGEPGRARELFDRCFGLLPGELAPKLALAFSLECAGEPALAAARYDTVWRTDHALVSAAFGLARTRPGSKALEQVPHSSVHHTAAQAATVATLARNPARDHLTPDSLEAAGTRLADLRHLDRERRDRLSAELLEAALGWLRLRPSPPPRGTRLLGAELTEPGVRTALEGVYRELAKAAPTRAERYAYVDRANAVRPRTWL